MLDLKLRGTAIFVDAARIYSLAHGVQETNTRKHLFITLISSVGLQLNEHSIGLIDQQLTLDDLFVPWQKEG